MPKRNWSGLSILAVWPRGVQQRNPQRSVERYWRQRRASTQKLSCHRPPRTVGTDSLLCMTDHPGGHCIKMCGIKNADKDFASGVRQSVV
jgi:hypothetical protein